MIDPSHFRNVLGAYPTGVSVITARDRDGDRHGMVVGTLCSISLDPPLVGFFPAKTSASWKQIEQAGRFCVNILGNSQIEHCKQFSSSNADKFEGTAHGESPSGMPLLDSVVAWIDCTIEHVIEVGDHWLAVGLVEALEQSKDNSPLLFFRGRYCQLAERTE